MNNVDKDVVLILEDEKYPRDQIKNILLEYFWSDVSIEFIVTDMIDFAINKLDLKPKLITVDGSLWWSEHGKNFILQCKENYPEILDKIIIYSWDDRFINEFPKFHDLHMPLFDKNYCIPERKETFDVNIYDNFRETLINIFDSDKGFREKKSW